MSRTTARERFTLEEFQKEMAGVYTTSIGEGTLDEAPMAYKSLADIIDVIRDSVDVIEVLKPLYNFKAGGPRGAVEDNEGGKEYVIVMKTICLRRAGIGVEQMPITDDMVVRRVRAAVKIALEKK